MIKYVALFRGINVGGNKKVNMEALRNMMASVGYKNIKTILNSGNLIFESSKTSEGNLIKIIEENFTKTFGFESKVMVRTISEIELFLNLDPFKNIQQDKNTQLYVTFLPEKKKSSLNIPYSTPEKDFQILQIVEREVFWLINKLNAKTVDAMAFIEKEFGKNVTTRNWNTVEKIVRA